MTHLQHRACQNCIAFNRQNQQGEPTCWNLVSLDGRQPTASDWCDDHRDGMEDAMLDEVLDQLPFDDCGEDVESEIADRVKAVDHFNRRLFEARRTTAQAMKVAAS